jgi:putative DNA primase/helicase
VANCGSAGKHPRTAHGLKDATDNPATLEEWWRRWPLANVGIATGAASGIDALDIDLRHQGDETLAAFERANGTLPATVMSHTGGGGLHLLFTHTEGIGNSAGKLGRGVDVRGDGGYIVAPPSLHRSGRPYAWDVDHHPDDIAPAALPAWLIAQLVPPKEAGSGTATDPMEWAELIANTAEQGFRNTTATRLVGYLLAHRIDPYVALEIMRLWAARCHPPLGDEELCRIIASICRREELKRKEDQFHV